MSETLILKSVNGNRLTDKLIDLWLDMNEIFVTKKTFSEDRYSVEITFVDEERAEMVSDMLTTCYSGYISIEHSQTLMESLNNSYDDERAPSPVELSSAVSISSKASCFSLRLVGLDKKNINDPIRYAVGRGRGLDKNSPQIDMPISNEIKHHESNSTMNIHDSTLSTPSIRNNNISSGVGRGRSSLLK